MTAPPIEEHYAVVEDNTIVNVVVCDDPGYAADQGWLALDGLDPLPWIGWTYDGTNWNPPEDEPPPPPSGLVAQVIGPDTAITVPSGYTFTTILSADVDVAAGAVYQVNIACYLALAGSSQHNTLSMSPADVSMGSPNTALVQSAPVQSSVPVSLNGSFTYTATDTTTVTFVLAAATDNKATVDINTAELTVIGGS